MSMVGDISKSNLLNFGKTEFNKIESKLDQKLSNQDLLDFKSDRAQDSDKFKSQLDKKLDVRKEPVKSNDDEKITPYNKDVPKKFSSSGPIKAKVTEPPQQMDPEPKTIRFNEISEKENVSDKLGEEQKAILQFMMFMKEQYGIEPEKLVQALGTLSDKELMSSPEDSMLSFFKNLGIKSEDMEPAKEQYLAMLAQLNSQINQMQSKQEVVPVDVQVIDPKKQRIQDTNRKLDEMNASFFMNSPVKKSLPQQTEVLVKPEYGLNDAEPGINDVSIHEQKDFFVNARNPADLKTYDLKQQPQQIQNTAQTIQQTQDSTLNDAGGLQELTVQKVESNSLPLSESGLEENTLAKLSEKTENLKLQLNNLENTMTTTASDNSETSNEDLLSDNQSNVTNLTLDKQVEGKSSLFAADLKAADKNVKSENPNIQQIMNQANVMIRRGGGEMKMQLSPEGLGNVHLKVKVEDGKVGIQMIADTTDAKRLLEGSIGDLKANLSQHKMTVDTFKVDVSDKFSESLNQQSDLNREDARNFLGQFREQNEFRHSFFNDSPGIKAYRQFGGKEPTKQPVEPVPTRNEKGRIHLVA